MKELYYGRVIEVRDHTLLAFSYDYTFPREGFGLFRQTETRFCSLKIMSWSSKPWTQLIKEHKRYVKSIMCE